MKQAILAVSFGTTFSDAEESCIRPIETALAAAFPGFTVRRAYTSPVVIDRLRQRGISVDRTEEAIARLRDEGFGRIAVVPTHVIAGGEYEKVLAAADGLPVSKPLLGRESDLQWMAGLLGMIAAEEQRPLLAMGHGSEHSSDEIYARLRKYLPKDVFLACMEGKYTLENLLPRLEALPERSLSLTPMMIVAGSHARRGLAGDGNSWKSMLEARGFDVRVRMQGLGALEAVQQRFVEKAREIL